MNQSKPQIAIFWFRRDLRIEDNAALFHALKSGSPVLPIFIFDTYILDKLVDKSDPRITFIHQALSQINLKLKEIGSTLLVFYGKPEEVWKEIIKNYNVKYVFANHDYEPYALERELQISNLLSSYQIPFHTFKDQCIFEKSEIVKDDQKPYTVFTPYSRKWKAKLNSFYLKSYPNEKYFDCFLKNDFVELISLNSMGFETSNLIFPDSKTSDSIVEKYAEQRDFPGINGTTRISIHLRFGTVSIRKLAQMANLKSETWLNELIWRDFYMMILFHFPHVKNGAFRKEYDKISWRNNETEFDSWCKGKTGYAIVDAGMRELNATGFMHNRVRMIVASFLTKHLLIDYKWGEAYFAKKLLDFDLSANNGGWQWAAGSGCDAAPYFRVFNPYLQTQKFDSQLKYIKKWVPEFQNLDYKPIVEHDFARNRCLEVYKQALKGNISLL